MSIGGGLQSLIPPKKSRSVSSGTILTPHSQPIKPEDKLNKTGNVFYIKISKIKSNPHQPRKSIEPNKLQELADSIREYGILQPLVITRIGEDNYQLIAGERRLEAAKIAGLAQVPVVIRDSSEQEKLELALVENLQRDDLNPIEKAHAFKKLIDDFNFIQQDVAKRIGKSREVVANTLRLLNLPAEIQRAVLEGKITEGHARVILIIPDIEKQILLFKNILKNSLSVRQAEALVRKIVENLPKIVKIKSRKDFYLKELEDKLSSVLGTRVRLTRKGKKGKITIEFFSQEEMDGILDKILKK